MNRTQLRGIVVAANSLEEAQDLYTSVATGQNVKALQDENDNFVVLASANSDINLLNPLTGADDLVESDGLVDQMEFLSSDSSGTVNAHYTICVAGCNAHILADDPEMLQFCPACASAVTDLDAEQIAAHAAGGEEDGECGDCLHKESAIASGATLEEAVASFRDLVQGVHEPVMVQSTDTLIAVAGAHGFDSYTGDAATVVEVEAPALLQSLASSADEVTAHHFICASSSCESPHVISSDDMPVFCPSCASGLLEPEDELDQHASLSASDDDDFEEDEDDEDEDDDSDDSDEDDEDDSEDEDEVDDDSEDDDEEDDLSLSLSSNRARTAKRVRMKAQASVVQPEIDTESVSVSFLAIASSGVDALNKFEVAYAGNIKGENVWYATIDRIPVAMALASKSQHKEIFDSEVFGRAVRAQASEHGIPAALVNMGFEEIKPEIEVGEHVTNEIRTQVAEQVQEVRASAEQDKAELTERFGAAMAIAATGITRGFFKDKSNPIAQSLIQSLSSAGLSNAAGLVNQAFALHSDNYHKALIAQASTIMGYDLDVQNQLATAVQDSNVAIASDQPIGRPVVVGKEREEAVAAASQTDFADRLNMAFVGLGNIRR